MKAAWLMLCAFAVPAVFAQNNIQNAKLQTDADGGNLTATVKNLLSPGETPVWIAYEVDAVPGRRSSCCWNNGCQGCSLEDKTFAGKPAASKIYLEGFPRVQIFLRTVQGHVDSIHTYTPDCALDSGGLTVHWIDRVESSQSVALLRSLIAASNVDSKLRNRLSEQAIAAIAIHKDEGAEEVLEELTRPNHPDWMRRQAVHWIAQARGGRGFAFLQSVLTR